MMMTIKIKIIMMKEVEIMKAMVLNFSVWTFDCLIFIFKCDLSLLKLELQYGDDIFCAIYSKLNAILKALKSIFNNDSKQKMKLFGWHHIILLKEVLG